MIERLADVTANVLITGESGTGKELVARNLHRLSARAGQPFLAVNCAALNHGVLESELFGHGRGSFTGAVQAHAGLFEQAHGGTLFLDEIGEVPPFVQAKLLRVIQDREIRRMGTVNIRQVDVRIVSATNSDLERDIQGGTFRADLYYRLNVVGIHVDPLRDRGDDIFELVAHFFNRRCHVPPELPEETRQLFERFSWPGNVRQLENELERILALWGPVRQVTPGMLSPRIIEGQRDDGLDVRRLYDTPLPRAVGYLEEDRLRKTLTETRWNKSQTARRLGLSRQGVLKKIKRYGISPTDDGDGSGS
jgi:two-component system response regulator PilR (NtrC family)